jgi:hypothetical protein
MIVSTIYIFVSLPLLLYTLLKNEILKTVRKKINGSEQQQQQQKDWYPKRIMRGREKREQ